MKYNSSKEELLFLFIPSLINYTELCKLKRGGKLKPQRITQNLTPEKTSFLMIVQLFFNSIFFNRMSSPHSSYHLSVDCISFFLTGQSCPEVTTTRVGPCNQVVTHGNLQTPHTIVSVIVNNRVLQLHFTKKCGYIILSSISPSVSPSFSQSVSHNCHS